MPTRGRSSGLGGLRASVVLAGLLALGPGCGLSERFFPDDEAEDASEAAPEAAVDPFAAVSEFAALRRGENEAVYEVDSFVFAMIRARVEAGAAGLVPADKGEHGYVLKDIDSPALAKALGLAAGDRFRAINNITLEGPARAREALATVDAQGVATVAIVRDGIESKHEYLIVDGLAWSRARGDVPEDTRVADAAAVPDLSVPLPAVDDPFAAAEGSGAPTPASGGRRPTSGGRAPTVGKSGGGASTKPASGGAAKPSAPSPGPSSAACAGGTCTISRAEFNKYLSNPAGLSSQASVSPTGLGYKLTTVRRGSSIERLGFRSGDTITHVNGHALADDADAMALYFGLGQTSTFQVRYLRGGSPGVRTIKVR